MHVTRMIPLASLFLPCPSSPLSPAKPNPQSRTRLMISTAETWRRPTTRVPLRSNRADRNEEQPKEQGNGGFIVMLQHQGHPRNASKEDCVSLFGLNAEPAIWQLGFHARRPPLWLWNRWRHRGSTLYDLSFLWQPGPYSSCRAHSD